MESHGGVELLLARLNRLPVARPLQVEERFGSLLQQLDSFGVEEAAQSNRQAVDVDPCLDAAVGVHPVDAGEEAVDLLRHRLCHRRHDLHDLVRAPSRAGPLQFAVDSCHVMDDPCQNPMKCYSNSTYFTFRARIFHSGLNRLAPSAEFLHTLRT